MSSGATRFSNVQLGKLLILLGILALPLGYTVRVLSYRMDTETLKFLSSGNVIAYGSLLIMAGLIALFPDILKTAKGEPSSMRVAFLFLIGTFSVLMVRQGWSSGATGEVPGMSLGWGIAIAGAFLAKAGQKFFETRG